MCTNDDAVIELGAASELTQGVEWTHAEEGMVTPDYRD
jgi:hypothetical protein